MKILNNYIKSYRVEKNGKSFYINAEQLEYYADNGYTIYKQVEEKVDDITKELSDDSEQGDADET